MQIHACMALHLAVFLVRQKVSIKVACHFLNNQLGILTGNFTHITCSCLHKTVTSQLAESQLAECLYVGVRNRVRARG